MATSRMTISAPARLGGIGLMIDHPRTVIAVSENDRLRVTGTEADACQRAVSIWFKRLAAELQRELSIKTMDQIPVAIEVKSSPPRHCGFGTGTQISLSTAAAIGKLLGLPAQSP